MQEKKKTYWTKIKAWVWDKLCQGWDAIVGQLTQHKVLLLTIGVLYVFRGAFIVWIKEFICPITSKVAENDIWVLFAIVGFILVVYIINSKRLWRERKIVVSRLWTLGLLYAGYRIFRDSGAFVFSGLETSRFSYVDTAWLVIIGIELLWIIIRIVVEYIPQDEKQGSKPFLFDTPVADDEMKRKQYAEEVVKKIKGGTAERGGDYDGAFAILLNEHYGAGKTSFMLQLEKCAKEYRIDVCWFKPWMYEEEKSLIMNFIRVLQERLGVGDSVLQQMLRRYANVLANIDGYKVFSFLQWDEKSIEAQFTDIKSILQRKKSPIIVLIDDVDRLQSEELLRMLQMVRNMGDFPYIYYVIAGDKQAMQNRLHEAGISEPDEYLKKFFNFELNFPADDMRKVTILRNGITEIFARYEQNPDQVLKYIEQLKYKDEIFANIRDIKRYLNILDFMLCNLRENDMMSEVYLRDVAGICMIQYLDTEFYQTLRDHNEYILTYSHSIYHVKDDFTESFANREDKKIIEAVARQITGKQENKDDDSYKIELKEKVKSNYELVRWAKPTKMEIMGELLGDMFPKNTTAPSKSCICYKTEYFKYFSTTYKGTEMSNAEVIGIMEMKEKAFKNAVTEICKAKKIEAFRHKMLWYIQTQPYNRKEALMRVFDVFDMDEVSREFKEVEQQKELFKTHYGSIVWAIFRRRETETKEDGRNEWLKLKRWLVQGAQYKRRIFTLHMLQADIPNRDAYIFESSVAVNKCIQDSMAQFVRKVWTKDMYNPEYISYLGLYKEIEWETDSCVYNEVKALPSTEEFLFHITEYVPTSSYVQWNEAFISNVLSGHHSFDKDVSSWIDIVPDKWQTDVRRLNMNHRLTVDTINHNTFLKHATHYWREKEGKR